MDWNHKTTIKYNNEVVNVEYKPKNLNIFPTDSEFCFNFKYENGISYFFSAPSFFTERLDVIIYYHICKLFIKPKKKGILGWIHPE